MDEAARDQKVAAAKKKKYQKKKKGVGSVDSTNSTRKISSESTAPTGDRRNSVASDSGSVRADGFDGKVQEYDGKVQEYDGKVQEPITIVENSNDNFSAPKSINSDLGENQNSKVYSDYIPQITSATSLGSHSSLVEGLQPISQPHGQQSQPNLLSNKIDLIPVVPSVTNLVEESLTPEDVANICHMQQQTIAVLVDEKTALTSRVEKYSAMEDRYKRSEELLEEGQLLVDALRRQNAELEEKIRSGEDRHNEAERDNKQLMSQLNTKDSIIEQLSQEKANARSVSDEVESLQKTLQDKVDRCEALEIELSNLRHKFTNTEQLFSENVVKLSETELLSRETQAKFESMVKEIQHLTDERSELTQKVEIMSSSLETKEVEALSLSEQASSDAFVIEELKLERDNFSKELQTVQSENSKLTRRIKDITTKIDGLSSDNHNLIAQLTELREKVIEISNDKFQLAEKVDKEKSRADRLEKEVNLYKDHESMKVIVEEEKNDADITNGTTREIIYEENQPLDSEEISNFSSQEELKQQLFKERQKSLNLEFQLKRMNDSYNNNKVIQQIDHQTSSPSNSAYPNYSSQFSSDFEIGKCSGCIGEVFIV
ncbi:17898_t:CDS:2 [Funneliformis geosporum]|uniref:17898_t:CDS:1 n=1 Tax=Funneliformis geosporum TaxID=1117311 RepID=A0A9W4SJJ5_9GLOM|nr:17898_t:CDS:2 [Funneliformis geosporum]